ncbi:class I SAM-dependent methyltransferase [Swingsia samuiensis]|uniref:Class I SAM-dependent methyltransferase n=1 Tax=Swingsia samuiensis TaxID=1293412 RepID=A0A4Y6UHL2_9PROT|nr:class I SAM-dependent methyltransferase [Swingsia samuiensis]QDH16524.1 class I SAM-dependent methyltransferase [Swingsia samuiensis]
MTSSSNDARDQELAAQYEAYPYPERDPRDEEKRLLIGSPSHLREIDYWVFAAQRSPEVPLRALVAGCGTGDGAIMLATHLMRASRPGEVVCVDRSKHALSIAKARAEVRGLTNIRFIEGSLTEIDRLNLGEFDYIDCCGVLHHLPDPLETLRALTGLLKPDGGMGLMVYAPHGRTGVYMVQEALEILSPFSEKPSERLDVAKRVMQTLPATAWLRQNGNFGDHLTGGDAGLYDLLLNPRDRAYTITDFLQLLDDAGLETTCLLEPARYNPALFLPNPKLRSRIEKLSWQEQAAVAEALTGNMATHVVYVVKKGAKKDAPDYMDVNSVPIMREIPGDELAKQIRMDGTLVFSFGTLTVPIALPHQIRSILPHINGGNTIADLIRIMSGTGMSKGKFLRIWREAFPILESLNRTFVRASTHSN